MCGEGLSKAQLKIDETILDESENESDLKSGRLFSLCASETEEILDLDIDERRFQKLPIAVSAETAIQNELIISRDCLKVTESLYKNSGKRESREPIETSDEEFEKCRFVIIKKFALIFS